MPRFLFQDDYSEGAHPDILAAIVEGNDGQQSGYGLDYACALAAERIRSELGRDAAVHFVSSGSQANSVCISHVLRPHEGVIAATTAHISVHETGAIEATGHKIILVTSNDGKLTPALIDAGLAQHEDEHMVKPKLVSVSQSTETGTVYSTAELTALCDHAHQNNLLVYLDGARLAMACAAANSPSTLREVADCGIDMMYIGGAKNGGLVGEAIVILNPELTSDFRYTIKQRGALLAKGRVLGLQFARFFAEDRLWYRLGVDANASAQRLSAGLIAKGVKLDSTTEANQVFAIFDNAKIAELQKQFGFYVWRPIDAETSVARLVCSWATPEAEVDRFIAAV